MADYTPISTEAKLVSGSMSQPNAPVPAAVADNPAPDIGGLQGQLDAPTGGGLSNNLSQPTAPTQPDLPRFQRTFGNTLKGILMGTLMNGIPGGIVGGIDPQAPGRCTLRAIKEPSASRSRRKILSRSFSRRANSGASEMTACLTTSASPPRNSRSARVPRRSGSVITNRGG